MIVLNVWRSDNVARAGLTPKLRATNVLCQIVDYVAQESHVFNPQVISQNKRLVSYCLCYFSFGVISDSDIIGEAFFVIVIHLVEILLKKVRSMVTQE